MKKFGNFLKGLFTTIIVIVAVAMMIFTIFSVTMVDKNDRNLFGYRAFKVMSDSMSATDFSAGDLIIVQEVDTKTLVEGDIISFISMSDDSFGEVITHKIRSIKTNSNGALGFETYGTTTGVSDEDIVSESNVLGKYIANVPKLGYFFNFIKTTPGYIICIFAPFLILILIQASDSIKLFRQYKKEQKEEIEKEKAAIAKEREDADKMMRDLLALKDKLEAKEIELAADAQMLSFASEAEDADPIFVEEIEDVKPSETDKQFLETAAEVAQLSKDETEVSDATDLSSLWD